MNPAKSKPIATTQQDQGILLSLLGHCSHGLVLLDADDRFLHLNERAATLLAESADSLLGKSIRDLPGTFSAATVLAIDGLRHGTKPQIQGHFDLHGVSLAVHYSRATDQQGRYLGTAVLLEDREQQPASAGHMIRAEKMAILGELAAAVAHEINSPLGGIMESVRIIQDNPGNWEKINRFLPLIMQGLQRIQSSVQRVLAFGRPAPSQREPIRLADVVFQSIEFLSPRARTQQVQIDSDIQAPDVLTYADPHALAQMIINLLNNALDSLQGRPDGRIDLKLSLQDSATILLDIGDNGSGVPEHLRERVFDPFFTTKATGKGTGLGLSISANIVAEYRGQISLKPRPGGGTVFTVLLPLYQPQPPSDSINQPAAEE